jgi:hypothetical protein
LVDDALLIQIAGGLAALYAVGALIASGIKIPTAITLTTAAQGLFLITILFTYVSNLAANIGFILAIMMTIANIIVIGYQVRREPSSNQKMRALVDEVLSQPARTA